MPTAYPTVSVPHPHPLEVAPADARPLRARPGAPRFFAAYGQSAIGSGAAVVALPLLPYERPGSPWALTAILLCLLAPAALAGPVLGSVVDRFGRRRSAIAGDLVRAAAYLALWQAPSVAVMGAAAMLAGLGAALFEPATIAGLPQLAGRDHEPRAQSLYAALADFGDLAGPAVAALAFAVVGPSTVMAVNAATFLVCAL